MPNSRPDPLLVAALLPSGFYGFEYQLVAEVYGLERPELGSDWFRLITCAETKSVRSRDGRLRLTADHGIDALEQVGTIVVPGWPPDQTPSPALRDALLAAFEGGSRLVSICSGAFLLARLGVLDGRRATTHWLYREQFEEAFPTVTFMRDVLYVDEGDVLTSAGSAAGLDLLLHLVRKDKGVTAANNVARRLVIPPHRQGGQLQFVEAPVPAPREGALPQLIDEILANPSADWSIETMAEFCKMSSRTFSRRFVATTGQSPGHWLTQQRIGFAKTLLETTATTLDDIALVSGLGSADNLKRRFRTHVGVSPSAYRRSFSGMHTAGDGPCHHITGDGAEDP
ncbi:MAG: helix-turn-helix domain-containing protein [Pseudomonadota bacterium]